MENPPSRERSEGLETPTQAADFFSENTRRNIANGVLLTLAGILAIDVAMPQTVHAVQDFMNGDNLKFVWDATTAGAAGIFAHGFIQAVRGKRPYVNLREQMASIPPRTGRRN